MSADELPNPPRKASWKRWIVVLAGVLVIVLAVLFLKAPSPEPVSVRFVGSTNWNGDKFLKFTGTNGLPRSITYEAFLYEPSFSAARTNVIARFSNGGVWKAAGAGETFTFFLRAPREHKDWQAIWYVWQQGPGLTRWEKARADLYLFLIEHRMGILARPFADPLHRHFISSSELKE